jgi:WD40 repeat protein
MTNYAYSIAPTENGSPPPTAGGFFELAGSEAFTANNVAWMPSGGRLAVCGYSTSYGPNGYVFDEKFEQITAKFDVDASVDEFTISPDGRTATVLAYEKVLCVHDLAAKRDVYFQGTRVLKDPGGILGREAAAPFISHARHDGKQTLIYTIDFYKSGGSVHVMNLENQAVTSFAAGHKHVELDVDFGRRRMALTGDAKSLSLFDFDGNRLAFLSDATLQRNACVEISPSGNQIAVGSWDTGVTIYSIDE